MSLLVQDSGLRAIFHSKKLPGFLEQHFQQGPNFGGGAYGLCNCSDSGLGNIKASCLGMQTAVSGSRA